jgi:hypothetical protein
MRSIRFFSFLLLAMFECGHSLLAQATAFTYQGRLDLNSSPANGSYDLTFSLFNTNTTGVAITGPITNSLTAISNGLFTTSIDFGRTVYLGPYSWLEIAVRTNGDNSFVTLAPRQPLTPAPYAIVAGSLAGVINLNFIATNATVGGGSNNQATAAFTTIAGGVGNHANGDESTIGGGINNVTSGNNSTVAGGDANLAQSAGATVSGGGLNQALGSESNVGGGEFNKALNSYATVSGGFYNVASGFAGSIPGGEYNVANGSDSFAAGYGAQATNNACFVWNDGNAGSYSSTADHQFCVHAAGGIVLDGNVTTSSGGLTVATDMHMGVSSSDYRHFSIGGGNSYGYMYGSFLGLGDGIHMGYNYYYDAAGNGQLIHAGGGTSRISAGYGGVQLATGDINAPPTVRLNITPTTVQVENATFNNSSDRNLKQNFTDINPLQMLNKVLKLPVSEWSYKFDPATRHIGPVAQDFYSVFNVGTDDKHIAPIDEGGIALAAIKGLNQKLEEKDAEIQKLSARVEELEKMIKGR